MLKEDNMNNNTIFNIVAILLLGYILYPRISVKFNKNVKNVSGNEAAKLIGETKDLVILDVRTQGEHTSRHIPGSKLMPVNEIKSRIGELEKYRGKPILVHCASGSRSPKAVRVLLKNKFGPIYHMSHGLSDYKGRLK
jgi:rhodanese-related sulfurtransferase